MKLSTITLHDLPSDALVLCFEFVGRGRCRFVAGTCRRFRKLYLQVDPQKRTFWKKSALSATCAELYLRDNELLGRMEPQEVMERLAFVGAGRGKLEIVQWAHEHGLELTTATRNNRTLMDVAVRKHHTPVHMYLHEAGCEYTPRHCRNAIRRNNLTMVRFFHEHKCAWDANVVLIAADQGNMDIVKYLQEHGCDRDEQGVLLQAAGKGHLDVLKYLFEDAGFNLAMHSGICSTAAVGGGHIEILRYLDQEGMLNRRDVCIAASSYGQLEVLQYSVENFSAWNDNDGIMARFCLCVAAEKGRDHVVQWIRGNM